MVFKAPCARFVDDFFGVSRVGSHWTAGRLLSVVSRIVRFPIDDSKGADDLIRMVVLGVETQLDWPWRSINARLEDKKASKWLQGLLAIMEVQGCEPSLAEKFAGRFNFAVTSAGNRVGRAFIGPFYAHAHGKRGGHRMSAMFMTAAAWWAQYLVLRPLSRVTAGDRHRRQIVTWQDAAGASRWVAAVLQLDGKTLFTRLQAPQPIWDQLLPQRG